MTTAPRPRSVRPGYPEPGIRGAQPAGAGLALIGLIPVLALGVSEAAAADIFAQTTLEQKVEYDDNFSLDTSGDGESLIGSTSSALIEAGARTERFSLSSNARLDFARFPQQPGFDSDDQFVRLQSGYQTPTFNAGLFGEFTRDTTRTSDVEDTGQFIRDNVRREVFRVGNTWGLRLTNLDSLNLSASYQDTHRPNGELPDSHQAAGSLQWTRSLTARTGLVTSLSGSNYESSSGGKIVNRVASVQTGFSHIFSPRLQATLTVGPSVVFTDTTSEAGTLEVSDSNVDVGYGLTGKLSYKPGERLTLSTEISRSQTPSTSTGVVQETTSANLIFNYRVLNFLAFNTRAGYSHRETLGSGEQSIRDFYQVEPGVIWDFADNLSLRISYRYRRQELNRPVRSANANGVFATLSVELPRLDLRP